MDNLSDEQLVGLYLTGEEKALKLLIERYFKYVYNFLVRFIGQTKEAEDLTQETFLRAWKNLKKFDQQKSFKVWLFSLARHLGIDYLRRKKIPVFSALADETEEEAFIERLADEGETIIDKINKEELAKEIAGYLKTLSEPNKTAILLHYGQEMSFFEIAESLGESVNTVKSRHRRALIQLRRQIAARSRSTQINP